MSFILFAGVTQADTQWLDENFAAVSAAATNPCTASGTNALTLTASTNLPAVAAYADYQQYSFVAVNDNTGAVTARVGSLASLNVYKASGAGPAALSSGDIVAGNIYVLTYNSALNSGAGGFQIDGVSSTSLGNQSPNTIYAGPASGTVSTVPAFRTLVSADLNGARGQYPGTNTNNDASAGNIGEFTTSTIALGSAVSLTSGTTSTITNLPLTAGDWDVWMEGLFHGATSTTFNNGIISLAASGTISTIPGAFSALVGAGATIFNYGADPSNNCGPTRFSLATTTTIYALANATFGASTCSVYGLMRARRVR